MKVLIAVLLAVASLGACSDGGVGTDQEQRMYCMEQKTDARVQMCLDSLDH